MKRSIFAATALLSMNMAFAAEGSHFDWSYAAQTAPDKWSQLKPEYQACAGMPGWTGHAPRAANVRTGR